MPNLLRMSYNNQPLTSPLMDPVDMATNGPLKLELKENIKALFPLDFAFLFGNSLRKITDIAIGFSRTGL